MGKRARHNQVAKQWRGCPEIRSPPGERAGKMCLWNRLHSPGPYPITTSLQRQGSRAQHGHPCGHPSQPPFLRLKEGFDQGICHPTNPWSNVDCVFFMSAAPNQFFFEDRSQLQSTEAAKIEVLFFFFCLVCSGPCCDGVSIK